MKTAKEKALEKENKILAEEIIKLSDKIRELEKKGTLSEEFSSVWTDQD